MTSRLLRIMMGLAMIAGIAAVTSAQDITFTTADGQAVSVSSFRDNAVILLFSGVKDPQRRDGLKALQELAERQKGRNVKICWVSINNDAEMSNDQLRNVSNAAPSVTVLRDASQAAFKRFKGAQLPTVVALDRQGNPFGQPRGGFNPNSDFINDLSSMIDALLKR
jgi:cytochrome oxidase Cu insertion factor (SCO1/SenC/PrrC family)